MTRGRHGWLQTVFVLAGALVAFLFWLQLRDSTPYSQETEFETQEKANIMEVPTTESNNRQEENAGTAALRLVSMNLANLESSAAAPTNWNPQQQLEAVKHELLQTRPHILALQECPSARWASETFGGDGYIAVGSVASHAGFVSLLIQKDIFESYSRVGNFHFETRTPAVMAKLQLRSTTGLKEIFVASLHLEPFEGGSTVRRKQILALKKVVGDKALLILAGDTNMRDEEEEYLDATQASSLRDAWKDTGASPETRYTWDTIDHHGARGFNEYYGKNTRQYQRRYDRIFYHVPETTTTSLQATEFTLIANTPMENTSNHFLSDHFGIAVSFRVG